MGGSIHRAAMPAWSLLVLAVLFSGPIVMFESVFGGGQGAIAALAGVVMLGFMYAAVAPWVWGSLNPVVNEHLVYALVLILIPLTSAGDTLGLGAWWKGLGLVKKLPFLI